MIIITLLNYIFEFEKSNSFRIKKPIYILILLLNCINKILYNQKRKLHTICIRFWNIIAGEPCKMVVKQ